MRVYHNQPFKVNTFFSTFNNYLNLYTVSRQIAKVPPKNVTFLKLEPIDQH